LKKLFRYHRWGILWGLFIILLTAFPGNFLPDIPTFVSLFEPDKLVHVFLFSVLEIFLIRGFLADEGPGFFRRNAILLSLNIGILLSGLTELIQKYFVQGRMASVYDFIANVAGCLLGWGLLSLWMRRQRKKSVK
jgi:VanZ family protein